jgi:predicted DNA-binding transcriptional regulator AlpA
MAKIKQTKKRRPHALQVARARAKSAALLTTPGSVRLLDKHDVCAIVGVSFPTVWAWMRDGRFPRGRVVGGNSSKTMWLSTEIEAWLAALPVRQLKGDHSHCEAAE